MSETNISKSPVSIPTVQYDHQRSQHKFTMAIGVLLVLAGILFGVFAFIEFAKSDEFGGVILVLCAAFFIAAGALASIPDARQSILTLFHSFKGTLSALVGTSEKKGENFPSENFVDTDDPPATSIGPTSLPVDEETPEIHQGLLDPLPSQEFQESQQAAKLTEKLTGWGEPQIKLEERWRMAHRHELVTRNRMGPMYLLDETYHFVDWNPIFDELIAKQLKLYRGMHVQHFVNKLANKDIVIKRSQLIFQPDTRPLVDLEPLQFKSEKFGRIEFEKIASCILDENGNTILWVVGLNISSVEEKKAKEFWQQIFQKLSEEANWTVYATSYDKLLSNFDAYDKLIKKVVSRVGNAKKCIDLGAGTGNTALELLKKPNRQVWAVEENDQMLERLAGKLEEMKRHGKSHIVDRIFLAKANVALLGEFEDSFFDAATMTNVLYAVRDPQKCLIEVNRVLKMNGVLSLSTSHQDTDVERLFSAIKNNLEAKNMFDDLEIHWFDAKQVHERMLSNIHRDSKNEIRDYIQKAGFEIEESEWTESTYVDAVIVAKAVKVRNIS